MSPCLKAGFYGEADRIIYMYASFDIILLFLASSNANRTWFTFISFGVCGDSGFGSILNLVDQVICLSLVIFVTRPCSKCTFADDKDEKLA